MFFIVLSFNTKILYKKSFTNLIRIQLSFPDRLPRADGFGKLQELDERRRKHDSRLLLHKGLPASHEPIPAFPRNGFAPSPRLLAGTTTEGSQVNPIPYIGVTALALNL